MGVPKGGTQHRDYNDCFSYVTVDDGCWLGPPPLWYNITTGAANSTHRANVGSMLGHHLRRRPNNKATMAQCMLFSGGGGGRIPHDS